MRPIAIAFAALACLAGRAQNPVVQSIIDAVDIGRLMADIDSLSGQVPVDVGSGPQTIFSRNEAQPGNALAADWLQQRIAQVGLTPQLDIFSAGNGENVLAEWPGTVHPERKVIICGHYDSMPAGPVASPAADDDGSGTVAVMEAMRILTQHSFENSIIFAFWDMEEQGKLGSINYANGVDMGETPVVGVVNMDAIAWDGDGDGLMRVHTRNIANSIALKDTAVLVNQTYAGLQLPMDINLPGATYSDHASFWSRSIGAILIIEDFDDDGNPHYHTTTDLAEHIDQPYFQGLARLGIGTAAVLARPVAEEPLTVAPAAARAPELTVFPNPTMGTTAVRVAPGNGPLALDLYDAMGRHVLDLLAGRTAVEGRLVQFDAGALPAGTYSLRMARNGRAVSVPMVRVP